MTRSEYRAWAEQQSAGRFERIDGVVVAMGVEVLSPTTSATDRAWKPREYFRLPSVRRYLIVWADRQQIVHHQRDDAGTIATTVLTDGEIRLVPPGISLRVAEIYAD